MDETVDDDRIETISSIDNWVIIIIVNLALVCKLPSLVPVYLVGIEYGIPSFTKLFLHNIVAHGNECFCIL